MWVEVTIGIFNLHSKISRGCLGGVWIVWIKAGTAFMYHLDINHVSVVIMNFIVTYTTVPEGGVGCSTSA